MASLEEHDEKRFADILRALPFALQGATTDVLAFDSQGRLVLPSDVSASLLTALAQLGEPCVLYRAIDAFLRQPSEPGLLLQALTSAIRDSLRSYLSLISEIEQKLLGAPESLGLAAAIAMVQAPTLYLRLFRTILEETHTRKSLVLSVIYDYTHHGDPLVCSHATELYYRVLEPFTMLLSQWESKGSLEADAFGELFVEYQEPHEFVFVESRVPLSMTLGEAKRSFERGKAVYFIRVVCGREEYDGRDKSDADIMRYTHELLLHDNDLLLHLRGLRDYMLLANGNFVDALFRNDSTNFLMSPLGTVSQYMASEFFIGTIEDMGAEQLEDRRVLRCIDAYILNLSTATEDPPVWEAFVGKYQLDSQPLRMIVSADAFKKYQRAFATLWRVRLAVYSLTESSLRLRTLASSGVQTQHLNDVHMIMNKMFLRLQEHLYYTVVGQHWSRLEATLTGAKQLTLNDVKTAHTQYIDAVAAVVSLSSNVQAVQTMTRLALGLQRILEEKELELAERSRPELEDMPQVIELGDAFERVASGLVLSV